MTNLRKGDACVEPALDHVGDSLMYGIRRRMSEVSGSARIRPLCACSVGILGAVGRKGRNSRLSHYHETSGLAQTREELVHTTQYIYEILHCHIETRVPHREALAPNIQILNMQVHACPPNQAVHHS